jgi:hypothetical protein
MQTAQSPLAKRLNERNAKKLLEERRKMEEDQDQIPATEEQLPQRPMFADPDRSNVTGDRRAASAPKDDETEVSSEQLPQRGQREEATSQRVLFEDNVRRKPGENSDRPSYGIPEEDQYENFSEKSSQRFPESQEGISEGPWFPDLGSQTFRGEILARKSVLEMFPTESFVAQPDTFIVNKMCSLIPVEGTRLALRFVSLRNTSVCSMSQAYRELLKELEMKERFSLFEKEFESSVGTELMQAVGLFVGWLIEHLDCEDSQAIGLTLMIAVRRLMADRSHPERFRHAKIALDYLGCYVAT